MGEIIRYRFGDGTLQNASTLGRSLVCWGGANSGEFRANSPESGNFIKFRFRANFDRISGQSQATQQKTHRLGRIRPNSPESKNPIRAHSGELARIRPNGFASGLSRLGHGWLEGPRWIRANVCPNSGRISGKFRANPRRGVFRAGSDSGEFRANFGRISGEFRPDGFSDLGESGPIRPNQSFTGCVAWYVPKLSWLGFVTMGILTLQ